MQTYLEHPNSLTISIQILDIGLHLWIDGSQMKQNVLFYMTVHL